MGWHKTGQSDPGGTQLGSEGADGLRGKKQQKGKSEGQMILVAQGAATMLRLCETAA